MLNWLIGKDNDKVMMDTLKPFQLHYEDLKLSLRDRLAMRHLRSKRNANRVRREP